MTVKLWTCLQKLSHKYIEQKVNIFSGTKGFSNIIVGKQDQVETNISRRKDPFDLLKPEVIIDDSSMVNPVIFNTAGRR